MSAGYTGSGEDPWQEIYGLYPTPEPEPVIHLLIVDHRLQVVNLAVSFGYGSW